MIVADEPNMDKFHVHVYTGSGKMQGIHIGADGSVANEHSELTARTADGTTHVSAGWPYPSDKWLSDKSKVNWVIWVVGTLMAPERQ